MNEKHYAVNGTDLYITENPALHSFCVGIYIYAGSMYEPERDNGISHLYEHTVFRNLKRCYDRDFYELLSEHGIFLDACTYKEFIQFTLYGIPEGFPFAMDILSKLFLPLDISPEEYKAEKGRIKAEIRETDPNGSLEYFHSRAVWSGTSLAQTIAGKWETVSRISLRRLNAFRDEIVTGGNLFFYGTGCLNEEMQARLRQVIAGLPIGERRLRRENLAPVPELFQARGCGCGIKAGSRTMAALSFDIDNRRYGIAVRDLLFGVLFLHEDAAIDRALSEDCALIYSYDSWQEQYRNISRFCLLYEIAPRDLLPSLRAVTRAIQAVKQGKFRFPVNLQKQLTGWYLMQDSPTEQNWSLAYEGHILGEPCDFTRPALGRYDGLDQAAVVAAAREILVPGNLTVSFKGTRKQIDTEAARAILSGLSGTEEIP